MAKEPFPLDRGWAWAIVFGCFVCVFFMVGTAKSTGMFLPEFQEYFNIPTSLAAMLMGGSAIVYAGLAPVCIMLGQEFTVRQVVMGGGLIGFIGMSIGSLIFSMEYVIATFGICFGIGNAAVYGNVLVILGVYFNKRRALANGVALAGASIGQFVLPPFIEFLLETYGLQGCLLLVGGVYFNVVAAASLFRPPSFWASPDASEATAIPLQDRGGAEEVGGETRGNGPLTKSLLNGSASLRDRVSSLDSGDSIQNACNGEDQGIRDRKVSDVDGPDSPLVSPSKGAGFGGAKETESAGKSPRYRSYMASTGSLCIRPLSPYGSCVDFEIEEWEEQAGNGGFCQKLMAMFDFSVMKSYVAVFILITNFLSFFGYFNFVLFLPAIVLSKGITKYDKALLVSACGIGDLIGRLSTGSIGDFRFITRYKLQAAGILLVGINVGCFIFANTFSWMMVHSVLYGFFGGVYVSLAAVVIIDFVGLKHMPRLLAVVMLIQGVGAAIGQPLLGGVKDSTGSFDSVVIICTMCCLAGGLVLLSYPLAVRLEHRRPERYRLLPVGAEQTL